MLWLLFTFTVIILPWIKLCVNTKFLGHEGYHLGRGTFQPITLGVNQLPDEKLVLKLESVLNKLKCINCSIRAFYALLRLPFTANCGFSRHVTNHSQDYNPHKLSVRLLTPQTFFCNLMTEVHFFSKRPAYFLSNSSFCKKRGEGLRQKRRYQANVRRKPIKEEGSAFSGRPVGGGLTGVTCWDPWL